MLTIEEKLAALTALAKEIGVENELKGWRNTPKDDSRTKGVPVADKLLGIMTEIGEATKVYADPSFRFLTRCYNDGGFVYNDAEEPPQSPEGFGAELADVIIRTLDLTDELGIDIGQEIGRKLRFNKTRPYRHGNKLL